MLLIQTALEQEFRAVASVLEPLGIVDRTSSLRYGHIAGQPCCLVRTGIGLQSAEQVLSKTLDQIERPQWLLSIGLAGALDAELRIGQRQLIECVKLGGGEPAELHASLNLLAPGYRQAVPAASLVSINHPALSDQAKEVLHRLSGAALCDMETHAVARLAVARGVPWLGARVVSDSAEEDLPAWFLSLPGLVEQRAWGRVGRLIATYPHHLPRLLSLAMRMRMLERQLAQFTVELIRNVVPP